MVRYFLIVGPAHNQKQSYDLRSPPVVPKVHTHTCTACALGHEQYKYLVLLLDETPPVRGCMSPRGKKNSFIGKKNLGDTQSRQPLGCHTHNHDTPLSQSRVLGARDDCTREVCAASRGALGAVTSRAQGLARVALGGRNRQHLRGLRSCRVLCARRCSFAAPSKAWHPGTARALQHRR